MADDRAVGELERFLTERADQLMRTAVLLTGQPRDGPGPAADRAGAVAAALAHARRRPRGVPAPHALQPGRGRLPAPGPAAAEAAAAAGGDGAARRRRRPGWTCATRWCACCSSFRRGSGPSWCSGTGSSGPRPRRRRRSAGRKAPSNRQRPVGCGGFGSSPTAGPRPSPATHDLPRPAKGTRQMNTEVEELLRDGMERFTAEVRAPQGLASGAAGGLRRRRMARRAMVAGGAADGHRGGRDHRHRRGGWHPARTGSSLAQARETAYIVTRVENALASEHGVFHGVTMSTDGQPSVTWAYGRRSRFEEFTGRQCGHVLAPAGSARTPADPSATWPRERLSSRGS